MNIDWFTLTAQVINFLILLALLKRFLFRPLRSIMEKREDKVNSRLEEAHQILEHAEKKSEEYQNKLDELERSKQDMINEARREAEERKKELLHEARNEIDTIQKNWEDSLEFEKETFFNELHRKTANNILDLLERLVQELANSSLEEQAINKFLEMLQVMDRKEKKRAVQSALDYGEGKMMVLTSFPLSKVQEDHIKNVLKEVFSTAINCKFKVNNALGFGIEIRAEGWKMGWNANIYLQDLKKDIEQLFSPGTETLHREAARDQDKNGII